MYNIVNNIKLQRTKQITSDVNKELQIMDMINYKAWITLRRYPKYHK